MMLILNNVSETLPQCLRIHLQKYFEYLETLIHLSMGEGNINIISSHTGIKKIEADQYKLTWEMAMIFC